MNKYLLLRFPDSKQIELKSSLKLQISQDFFKEKYEDCGNCSSESTGAKVWKLLLKLFESTLYMLVQNLFELTLEKDAFQS